jgi:predicted RNA binding protein YcfA (HicA-like mRNA interferase family)
MTKLPRLLSEEIIEALMRAGFLVVRVRGSHRLLRHSAGRVTVVPVHGGETISPGLLSKIIRDCEVPRDEFSNSSRVRRSWLDVSDASHEPCQACFGQAGFH